MANLDRTLTMAVRLRSAWKVCCALAALGCGVSDDGDVGWSRQGLAPAGSDSEIVSAPFKLEWYPGERARMAFSLSNNGTTDWTTVDPVFALSSLDHGWDWRYTATSATVPPATSHEFSFVISAPATPGDYSFVARMRALGLGDFGATITRSATVTPNATPEWGCEYVATASSVPRQLAPNENRAIAVTVRNVGQSAWQPGFQLVSEDAPAGLWHRTSALLDEVIVPGATKTWHFGIRAPGTPGSYRLRREMHASEVGEFRRSDHCVDVGIEVTGSTPLDSSIVSHDFPSPVAPGEPILATVVLQNTGTETWLQDGDYALGSLNTPTSLWAKTIVPLPVTAAPGASVSITLRLAAPPAPGNYEQKWQLRKLSGVDAGYFGATLSAAVVVDQATTPSYGATVVDQQIPLRMTAGKPYSVRISLKNTGAETWSGASFGLMSVNLPKSLWKTTLTSLAATESVAPGTTRTFGFHMRAPASVGQYTSSWRIVHSGGVGPFGQVAQLDGIEVTRCGNWVMDAGEACDDGNLESGDGCSTSCQRECGNGVIDSPEACDDGNVDAGDGCSPTCQLECGDGRIEGSEQCDGFELGGATCATVTAGTRPAGTLSCTSICTFDTSACAPPSPCTENILFEDPILEQLVRQQLGDPTGPITPAEASELLSLSVYASVESLSGLECFTNLTQLSVSGTQVSDLTPIAALTALEFLSLGQNDIVDVTPLSSLTNLTDLVLTANDIEHIEALSDMHRLIYLDLGSNRISDLRPLADLRELSSLWLDQNLVSDLTPLADLGLIELRVAYNRIESLAGVAGLEQLAVLSFDGNVVSDLTPLTNSELGYIEGSYNLISDLTPLSTMTSLHQIVLFGNTISTLAPLVQNGGLGTDDIVYVDLVPLDCPYEMDNIRALQARGVDLLTNCGVVTFSDPKLEWVVRAALDKPTGEITAVDAARVYTLSGDSLSISGIDGLEYFTNLWRLSLPNNHVSDLRPISRLVRLSELILDDNDIIDISPLAGLTGLTSLGLSANDIESVAGVANLRNLEELRLGDNRVGELQPLANLTSLRKLTLEHNQSTSVASLANLTRLQSLAFDGNAVSDLSPLLNLVSMGDLRFSGNQAGDLSPLARMTQLFHLDATSNLVADLTPLANLPSLLRVYLADNQISTLAPLVSNGGLDAGDKVVLTGNPLECAAEAGDIQLLLNRGVDLVTDCDPGQSCVGRELVGTYGLQIHNEQRICQKSDFSCSEPRVQDLPATFSLYTLRDDPGQLYGYFDGPGLWLYDGVSGDERLDAGVVYYPEPGAQPSIWQRDYPADSVGAWEEDRAGEWVRVLFDNGCWPEYVGPPGFVHVDIELATGRVLDFARLCDVEYSSIWSRYRMTGSGRLVCEAGDSCNEVENTAPPAQLAQVAQPDAMGTCQPASGTYHLTSVHYYDDQSGDCLPPPAALRETLVVNASTATSGTMNRAVERLPLQPFSTTDSYAVRSNNLYVGWVCGPETLAAPYYGSFCATEGDELKVQVDRGSPSCSATYIYQKQ